MAIVAKLGARPARSGSAFVDTNVFIYARDGSAPKTRESQ